MRTIRPAFACAAVLAAQLACTAAHAQSSQNNYSAMWWNANESGWGLNIAHQGDVLFPMWFTYNAQGQLQWYAVSGAALQADGSYRGEVFRFTGKPFNQISGGQAFNQSTSVGSATLRFTGTTALNFSYTVDGITQNKALTRFTFGTEPTCTFTSGSRASATNYSDIWWNASESGWGLTLAHQSDTIFGLWYTYDSANRPQWIAATGSKQADGSFKGDLNRATSGTAFNLINNSSASTFPLPKAGEFTLRFSDGETGTFNYTLDGTTQSKNISRFVFGAPVTMCTAATGGNNGGSGSGTDCFRDFITGDQRGYRTTATITGTPVAVPPTVTTSGERVRDGTFEGQAVKVKESLTATGQVEARHYYKVAGSTIEHLATESLNAATGQIAGTTRFTPALVFPRSMSVGQTISHSGTSTTTGTALGTLTRTYVQSYKLVALESVTVPAGTYNACKLETRETVSGSGVTENSTTLLWSNAAVGTLKIDFDGNVSGFNVRSVIEMTSFTPGN